MLAKKNKFVLLDRDGVINRHIPGGYVTSWAEFEFLPWALQGLRMLAQNGYGVLIASNQACVGKGLLSEHGLDSITKQFVSEVRSAGGDIRGVFYCTHLAEANCDCRKPQPGLLLRAQSAYGFHFADTFVVGDSTSDLDAARRVGAPAVLIAPEADGKVSGWGPRAVGSLYEAVEFILATEAENIGDFSNRAPRAKR
jgi:D-glycero-D-manno-heptose 1,7-bisphosphate phosphatase